jgi:hypothetical protein
LLPPYFPAFRGEDVLFGAMLVAIRPDCVGLEYPWCVPHLPIDIRKHSVDAPMTGWDAVALFSYYLTEQIDYRDTADPALNLSSLAQAIRRMAAHSDEVLLLEFRKQLAKSHIGSLRNLRRQLTVAEKLNSAELQAYVSRGIDQLQQALLVETSPVDNAGTRSELTEAEAFARLRAMMVGFAQGLTGWVDMRGVAATLTEELLGSGVMRPD